MTSVLIETGQKLSALLKKQDDTADRRELVAEIHDFLAMLEGIKPVFLHGRGLAPPIWIEEVLGIAGDLGLRVIVGPFWDATDYGEFPEWYAEKSRAQLEPYRAWYIYRDDAVEMSVRRINAASGRLSMTEEAQLLGYPVCCVNAHYERANRYHRGTLAILKRLSNGDDNMMQKLFLGGAQLTPVTQQEIEDFHEAFDIHEPRLGSWNMCHSCTNGTNSASDVLTRQYSKVIQRAKLNPI